jgi:hypothetical protein
MKKQKFGNVAWEDFAYIEGDFMFINPNVVAENGIFVADIVDWIKEVRPDLLK